MLFFCELSSSVSLNFSGFGLKYELGKSYRYGYETAIVFNQYSNQQTKSKDAGFYISTEIDLELIFQNADVQLYKLKVCLLAC